MPIIAMISIANFLLLALTTAQPSQAVELQPAALLDAAPFTRIRELVERADGTLIVVDQTENAVWRVDPRDGTRVRLGREGAGPGEYDNPTGVGPWSGDSVLVKDLGNGRLAVVGPDLEMGRTMPMFGASWSIPRATDAHGRMYFDDVTSVRMARQEDRTASDVAHVLRFDEARGVRDTLAELRIAGDPNPGPFPAWDTWAADADGAVVVVRNHDEYRVDRVSADGRVTTGPPIDEERLRVTDEDRAAWLERYPRGVSSVRFGNQSQPRERPAVAFPDHFPFARLGSVWLDAAGRAWVERHVPIADARPRLDVFDPGGRRIAEVRLPAGRRVIGFGPGGLWAVRVDEVDLQWLERYDLTDLPGDGGGT